jgi:hypothetical protein
MSKLTMKALAERLDTTDAAILQIVDLMQKHLVPLAEAAEADDAPVKTAPKAAPKVKQQDFFAEGFTRDPNCAANKSIDFEKLANAQLRKAVNKARENDCTYSVWYTVKKDGSRDYVLPYRQYSAKTGKKVSIKGGVLLADVAHDGAITTHVKGVFAKAS